MAQKNNSKLFLFWDSSAIVKWYLNEEFSEVVRALFAKASFHYAAEISHAEVLAAFYRLRREGRLSEKQMTECRIRFLSDFEKIPVIGYGPQVRAKALALIAKSALRGADLVQLACAVTLQQEGLPIELITFDMVLQNAAKDFGLTVREFEC